MEKNNLWHYRTARGDEFQKAKIQIEKKNMRDTFQKELIKISKKMKN